MQGEFIVEYKTENRLKAFNKRITVYSNADNNKEIVYIKGFVEPTPGKLRASVGNIKLEKMKYNVGNLLENESYHDSLRVANYYDSPAKIKFGKSKFFRLEATPEILESGDTGFIHFSLNKTDKQMIGNILEKLDLIFEIGESQQRGTLVLEGKLAEDFSSLTEDEISKAPRIISKKPMINFGEAKIDQKNEFAIEIENQGNSDLLIRSIFPSYGFELESYPNSIKPGESGKITLSLSPKYKLKKFTGNVKIYSNSPSNSELFIRLYGRIVK